MIDSAGMNWDSSRPVPWQRLMREWVVYVAIMAVIFVVLFRDEGLAGIFAGLLVSGPLYLGFGWLLAKLGYRRKTLKELRTPRAARRDATPADDDGGTVRPDRRRPAPTSRTSTGINRKRAKKRR